MPLFEKQIRIARVRGVSIDVDPSWIIIFLFLTWGLSAGYFPAAVPEQSSALYWLFGVLASVALFLSVTLHELGHSLVARARGMEVDRIVLFIFGGASQLEEEPEKPGAEFFMAIVGPLISFLLAALFWFLRTGFWGPDERNLWAAFVAYLALINLVLGLFNLLPGFPLDGGRVLRSILWLYWKDQVRATRVASQVGSGFGIVLMVLGGFQIFQGNPVGGFWYILIGFFLRNAAQGSFQQLALKKLLGRRKVRDMMTKDPVSVTPDLTLQALAEEYILEHHHAAYPVTEEGRLLGVIYKDSFRELPRERWSGSRVEDLMTPLEKLHTVSPDDSASELLRILAMPEGRMLVRSGRHLDGIVSRRDLLDYIALRSDVDVKAV